MKILQEETREPSSADHGKNVLYDIGESININNDRRPSWIYDLQPVENQMLLKVNLRKLEDLWSQSAISLRMRRSSETFPQWLGLITAQCQCALSVGGEKWKKWYHGTLRMFEVQDQSFNEIWSLQSIGLIEIKGFPKNNWCTFSEIKEENDANFQQGFWRFYLWGFRLASVQQAVPGDRTSQKGATQRAFL